jgi:hypothetical protein
MPSEREAHAAVTIDDHNPVSSFFVPRISQLVNHA